VCSDKPCWPHSSTNNLTLAGSKNCKQGSSLLPPFQQQTTLQLCPRQRPLLRSCQNIYLGWRASGCTGRAQAVSTITVARLERLQGTRAVKATVESSFGTIRLTAVRVHHPLKEAGGKKRNIDCLGRAVRLFDGRQACLAPGSWLPVAELS